MFDSLWGSKFSNKCKHAVKCIKTRAAPIRKKKQATVAFLKQVVAKLLASGEEDDAFRRMDELIVEINRTVCYNIIEKFCELILSQLPDLQKQRECSPEVLEAMATIIFAAARFPDLPELCDLRHVFIERYGGHIESSTNSEFVEKCELKLFSKEKKLQVMHNIADEFSVKWDYKEFGHKQSNIPSANSDKPKKAVLSHTGDEASPALANKLKDEIAFKGKIQWPPTSVVLRQQRLTEPKDIHVILTTEDVRSQDPMKTKELVDCEPENIGPYVSNNVVPQYDKARRNRYGTCEDECKDGRTRDTTPEVQDGLDPTRRMSNKKGSQEKYLIDKPFNIAPPYTKLNGTRNEHDVQKMEGHGVAPYVKSDRSMSEYPVKERNINSFKHEAVQRHEEGSDLPIDEKLPGRHANNNGRVPYMIPPYVKPKFKDLSVQDDQREQNSDVADYVISDTKDKYRKKDGALDDEKPKPVSVRRKFSKLPDIPKDDTPRGRTRHTSRRATLGYDDNHNEVKIPNRDRQTAVDDEMDNAIDYGNLLPRTSSDRRRHSSRHPAMGECEEDVAVDRLLMHYSKKGSAIEHGKERRKTITHPMGRSVDVDEVAEYQSGNGKTSYGSKKAKQPPERAFSLPAEPVKPAVAEAPSRATSMQPDMFSPNCGRVHPRLPDYDQLAARLAALRKM